MLATIRAVVKEGKIELLEHFEAIEGTNLLVTILPNNLQVLDQSEGFWLDSSNLALDAVWDNPKDDVYAQLLEA